MEEKSYEGIPSMDDFKTELEHSFKKINPGDMIHGTVIGVSDSEVTVDLNAYAEGIIKLEDLSNDPRFSIKADIHVGDEVDCTVLRETREGNFLLSMKEAENLLSWDKLARAKEDKSIVKVKISEAVNAGVSTYLYGIRAFIPASQLSLSFVEDTSVFVNKELECIVTEVNKDKGKLILSAKELLRDRAERDRRSRISRLQTGLVTEGTVEKLMPFGAFVNIGEDLTGLVHISKICNKRLKSPAEVLKVGDTVTVKVMEVNDGKISLSMTAVDEKEDVLEDVVESVSEEYSDGDSPATGLAALLANIKL
ncbi:MAG: S1 RNA-binding domain-containing protein [Lachnospiraceae bacterium]|nr:S1 RNA-binding domain-containing protein [Lachnospiraceae bacterium]